MTQKFYMRAGVPAKAPTTGEKSTVLPVGTLKNGAPAEGALLPTAGSSTSASLTTVSLGQTTDQDGYCARFSSLPLGAGTYGAGTWTVGIQSSESNASSNAFFVFSLYFWRPSTNQVVGFVYDSHTTLGIEWGNSTASRYGQVLTFTGANVTIQNGDILVLEVWYHSAQGATMTYNNIIYYDGATDITNAFAGTAAGSYINAPADIPGPTVQTVWGAKVRT